MAPNDGAVTTDLHSATHLGSTNLAATAEETVRLLKRQRDSESTSPQSNGVRIIDSLASPTKAARLALASRHSAFPPLTGAAALEEEQRQREQDAAAAAAANPPQTSENPSHAVLASLMSGSDQAMSRPSEAPQPAAPTADMDAGPREPATSPSRTAAVPTTPQQADGTRQDANGAGDVAMTEPPTLMDIDGKTDPNLTRQQIAGQEERPQPGSLSYPGSLQMSTPLTETPNRGLSYPVPGQGLSSPASAGKKHKCPYCNTEFTRHHNLKSHLLTHSQEKPYVCTDCQMRFRRLHDLKRHGKLHTGEKPHICPKCDRKFARGDALARHSKAAGGCAGRRSSLGGFGDGDDLDGSMVEGDEGTSGIHYEGGGENGTVRRQSMPSAAQQHGVQVAAEGGFGAHARTYPPGSRASQGAGAYPPNATQSQGSGTTSVSAPNSMTSNHTAGTSVSSIPGGGHVNVYSSGNMTESPKPLSPGAQAQVDAAGGPLGRPRSPGLSQQLQQKNFERRQSDMQATHGGRPKLPGLSQSSFPGGNGVAHSRVPSGGAPAADSGNLFSQSDSSAVWTYVQSLEEKLEAMSHKISSLEQEIATLKGQQQLDSRDDASTAAAAAALAAATAPPVSST